jgi:putative oxidoreductase
MATQPHADYQPYRPSIRSTPILVPAARTAPRYLVPLGRLMFVAIFLMSAPGHFSPEMVAYAAQSGVPLPQIAVPLSGVIALLGALSVLFGYYARIGAWMLVLFLIPVALMMHDFWVYADPMMRQMQMAHFMKNIGMAGAALLITYFGAGPVSFDARPPR